VRGVFPRTAGEWPRMAAAIRQRNWFSQEEFINLDTPKAERDLDRHTYLLCEACEHTKQASDFRSEQPQQPPPARLVTFSPLTATKYPAKQRQRHPKIAHE